VKQLSLLLAANGYQGMDGVMENAERHITCQMIGNKLNYESFLFMPTRSNQAQVFEYKQCYPFWLSKRKFMPVEVEQVTGSGWN